ncbi:MAG TPA: cobyric acid synthase [Rhodobacteraceae bacterium]|nr:cobyric acid synthase [Paracoccaceae bacterium]
MQKTRAIMIQGTGSNVGKSLLVAGICRALHLRGLRVRPFKPQNMSNNAAVAEGGEIGRAQALQAMACGVKPSVDMNPILLKPESETGAQVVVQGQRLATLKAREYGSLKASLMPRVLESFARLKVEADIVVVEGAGSPAEVNLRAGDIANMGFAEAANVPVVLVGDIDRGGVIAQLAGTKAVISKGDAARIKGFIVNKFRGDPSLFDEGFEAIEAHTGWQGLGTLPWFADAHKLPAEDALDIRSAGTGDFHIAVPQLSRMANFDDLDPLAQEPNVRVSMVPPGKALPGNADLVLIPGTKSTIKDLAFFCAQGWDLDLKAHLRRGGKALGICGGYQMLGQSIADPEGIEGPVGAVKGLGLLDVQTVMVAEKSVTEIEAKHIASGALVSGYEIHIGTTEGADRARPLFSISGQPEGAMSADGQIAGTYLHGLFSADAFRAAWLEAQGAEASALTYSAAVEGALDALAAHIEAHIDLDALLEIAQ